jgi:endonuclease/exonuclease/phosphatase family metal-dependent hydrolase
VQNILSKIPVTQFNKGGYVNNLTRQIARFIVITTCLQMAALGQSLSKGKGDLRVMTYNANEGSDFLEVQQAQTANDFLIAVGETITQVRATDPPARMQALANQIIAASPALVGVQELDQWSTGPFSFVTGCGATTMEFDMVAELQSALTAQGAHYQVIAQEPQYAFPPIPGVTQSGFFCVQVVNFIAILARTDLDPSTFQWSNLQTGQYAAVLLFPSPIGKLPLPRAWASVDASFHGRSFRFITSHLESVVPAIREAQGSELRSGPANTALPVVIAMDSNAQASPLPQDATYVDFTLAGYADVWSELFPSALGFTCCQDQLDNNVDSMLYQRIDLILTLGPIEAQNIGLFGVTQASKTAGGLWPSDHAGVAAQLVLETQ